LSFRLPKRKKKKGTAGGTTPKKKEKKKKKRASTPRSPGSGRWACKGKRKGEKEKDPAANDAEWEKKKKGGRPEGLPL